jgi:hypothetical protein
MGRFGPQQALALELSPDPINEEIDERFAELQSHGAVYADRSLALANVIPDRI